jgi:hypothetical protein
MLAPMMALEEPPEVAVRLARKYGWSKQAFKDSTSRLQDISQELDRRLLLQEKSGSRYLVGNTVSSADFYWANFAGLVKPLGHEDNPMPEYMRATYQATDDDVLACVTGRLEAHRDMMYERHITLPLDF